MMIQWIFAAAALCFTHYVTYAAGTQRGGLRQPRQPSCYRKFRTGADGDDGDTAP